TEILLEAAYFERMGIARTSKRLKLRSESSARFERGIDPNAVATNAARAMELLVEVADAQVAADAVDHYPEPIEPARIVVRTTRVNAVLGTDLDDAAVADTLARLGIAIDPGDADGLVAPDDLERSGAPVDGVVRAANPLRAEESVLRTRILAGLLRAVAGNHAQGLFDVALFEMGRVFAAPSDGTGPLPEEPEHLALVLSGEVRRAPVEHDRPIDVYDAIDAVRAVFDALGIPDSTLAPVTPTGCRPRRGNCGDAARDRR